MMKLACKDLDPETDCHFEATGNSTKEVAGKMMKHMREAHAEKMREMGMSDEEAMKMFESKVHG
ncbi:MAG: DUF1059 domain-containing protein [Candidatus Pacebacteria bacterium]|nr:DUF1059 domain-containing protein [Candidatus Paceibacterota bacterium]MDD5357059.1 DUF1059 domain-containing protein [Candidatus Paceibacterota bacterium]